MGRRFKILATIIVVIVALLVSFVPYLIRVSSYETRFSQVKIGQSKEDVTNLMGKPSENKQCKSNDYANGYYPNRNCFEILNYYSIFHYWAIAFDEDGKVIRKFHWSFDDGHGQPPN